MKKLHLTPLSALASLRLCVREITRPGSSIALANELGQMFEHGYETLQIDPTVTVPETGGVANSGHYLGYMRGSSQYYAKPWDGGSGSSSFPLGISPDSAYQTGDFLKVERLGAIKGVKMGYSAGAITIDTLLCACANGLIGQLSAQSNGTYWVVGRAAKTVAAASQEVSFIPCAPFLLTNTGGTLTVPTNPL